MHDTTQSSLQCLNLTSTDARNGYQSWLGRQQCKTQQDETGWNTPIVPVGRCDFYFFMDLKLATSSLWGTNQTRSCGFSHCPSTPPLPGQYLDVLREKGRQRKCLWKRNARRYEGISWKVADWRFRSCGFWPFLFWTSPKQIFLGCRASGGVWIYNFWHPVLLIYFHWSYLGPSLGFQLVRISERMAILEDKLHSVQRCRWKTNWGVPKVPSRCIYNT